MERDMSLHSCWPKASQSPLFCLNKVLKRVRRGTEETKDPSLETLDNRDGDMDVKAG